MEVERLLADQSHDSLGIPEVRARRLKEGETYPEKLNSDSIPAKLAFDCSILQNTDQMKRLWMITPIKVYQNG
ncbi:MAG: hypothetical protein A2Z14_03240 [Chloroflexi bacterium RBG_16_48_8]|nr:MAG: hypothetical protein A2Z14_03240 [Chloroflexi bacterium RBG_16_48_8]